MGAPRHFIGPQRHLAMAWRRLQAMGMPSNWERPETGTTITLIGNAITLHFRRGRGGVAGAGGWGGGVVVFPNN